MASVVLVCLRVVKCLTLMISDFEVDKLLFNGLCWLSGAGATFILDQSGKASTVAVCI